MCLCNLCAGVYAYVLWYLCVCACVYARWSGTVFIQASCLCIRKVSIQIVLRLVYIQVLWEFCDDQIGKIHDLIFFLICVIVLVPLTASHFLSHHESIQLILLYKSKFHGFIRVRRTEDSHTFEKAWRHEKNKWLQRNPDCRNIQQICTTLNIPDTILSRGCPW